MRANIKIWGGLLILCIFIGGLSAPSEVAAREGDEASQSIQSPESSGPYFSKSTVLLDDGMSLEKIIISGPPHPPPGYGLQRNSVALPTPNQIAGVNTLTVPTYDWVFGCSAVSAAMIAGYYDNNGYANMYTGPVNGGVAPLDSSTWGKWTDGSGTLYPNNPLIASHLGVDERTTLGSIDDYWVEYNSRLKDPYISGKWAEHTWGDSIGDYMKTSQSAYGNSDGSTVFYNYTSSSTPLTCEDMQGSGISDEDGTYGRKLFYEARKYTVTDCYNQNTDNTVAGGFSFAQYKAQIDAGWPVLLNLLGHSVVGVGYNDTGSTVYIHDTWDYSTHTMTWGGSYSDMTMYAVSIVNLAPLPPEPFSKISPADTDTGVSTSPTLSWGTSTASKSYEYCIDTTNESSLCETGWINVGGNTSVTLSDPLTNGVTYYWQVQAVNSPYTTPSNDGTWWSFTVANPTAVSVSGFTFSLANPPGITLRWNSTSEINIVGFDLYRAEVPGGDFILLNSSMIPAKTPGMMSSNAYAYTDYNAKPGIRYSYRLVQLDTNSNRITCCQVDGGYFQLILPLISH